MTFNEYQAIAKTTALYSGTTPSYLYPTLGLAGEAGEVVEKVKKLVRNNGGVANDAWKTEFAKEMGDVLWYLATLSTEFGLSLEDVAAANVQKLADRKERGVLHSAGDNR